MSNWSLNGVPGNDPNRPARTTRLTWFATSWVVCVVLGSFACAEAASPVVYRDAGMGTLSGDPGDLLTLAGEGLDGDCEVVYSLPSTGATVAAPPSALPTTDSEQSGRLRVVASGNAPRSITVQLADPMVSHGAYLIWVRNSAGEWSSPALLNFPKANWVSPSFAYETQRIAGLPRELRIIGRDLNTTRGAVASLRLVGPRTLTLTATPLAPGDGSLGKYGFVATLPDRLPPGSYSVEFRRGDGIAAVLESQRFVVLGDPAAPRDFVVSSYGCMPDSAQDSTGCFLAAAADATRHNGRIVVPAGTWHLANPSQPGVTSEGIVLSKGVGMAGPPGGTASIVRDEAWGGARPAFVLAGGNRLSNLRFTDSARYAADNGSAFVQVGLAYQPADFTTVDDIQITHVVFDRTFSAIGDGGRPIKRLFLTNNVFGSYGYGLFIEGKGGNVRQPFLVSDSVVRFNQFYPGSLFDKGRFLGPIASQVAAADRLDFSDNLADGSSGSYLYDPAHDARGWRGVFFFALRGNVEHVLVAANTVTCAGDKTGDGEAIVVDNNHNAAAFDAAANVESVSGTRMQLNRAFHQRFETNALPDDYYVGHFVQIVQGKGLGQVRRLKHYDKGAHASIEIDREWEVEPDETSKVVVSRAANDVLFVANHVDHRLPLCSKANNKRPSGGAVSFYANMIDSAIDGNALFDSSGILLAHQYITPDAVNIEPEVMFEYGIQVRNNLIDGEYGWESDQSWSGIQLGYAASPDPRYPPPIAAFSQTIAHNTIVHADARQGGAIALFPSWYEGPGAAPHRWQVIEGPLIYGNRILDIMGSAASSSSRWSGGAISTPRVGIRLADHLIWHATLHDNVCTRVSQGLMDAAEHTVKVCGPRDARSCDCP